MDSLTHRTGIDRRGLFVAHGGGDSPQHVSQPDRHANRHRRACATLPGGPASPLSVMEHVAEDGRCAYPDIVQYRIKRWDATAQDYVPVELIDLPPTVESHPDEYAQDLARQTGKSGQPCTLPYGVIVHNLMAYESLKARGLLEYGHRLPPVAGTEVTDNRDAPLGGA